MTQRTERSSRVREEGQEALQRIRAVSADVNVLCCLYRSQWVKHMAIIVTSDIIENDVDMGRQKSSDPPSITKYRHQTTEHSKMYDNVNLQCKWNKELHIKSGTKYCLHPKNKFSNNSNQLLQKKQKDFIYI